SASSKLFVEFANSCSSVRSDREHSFPIFGEVHEAITKPIFFSFDFNGVVGVFVNNESCHDCLLDSCPQHFCEVNSVASSGLSLPNVTTRTPCCQVRLRS